MKGKLTLENICAAVVLITILCAESVVTYLTGLIL